MVESLRIMLPAHRGLRWWCSPKAPARDNTGLQPSIAENTALADLTASTRDERRWGTVAV